MQQNKMNQTKPYRSPYAQGSWTADWKAPGLLGWGLGSLKIDIAKTKLLETNLSLSERKPMQVCLFDIDGTLLSSGGAGKAAMELALQEQFQVSSPTNIPFSGRTDRAVIRDLLERSEIEHTLENCRLFIEGYLKHLPHTLVQLRGKVLPGILELLNGIQNGGKVHLGLLTGNMRRGAQTKLSHFGLVDFFSFGGYGDHHWDRDDVAREALSEIHTQFGEIHSSQIWVIGDTPLDVKCAKAIGAKVAAVATGLHSREELADSNPDLLFTDLSDPREILANIS